MTGFRTWFCCNNTAGIMFGTGGGAFGPRMDVPAAVSADAVVAGDFTGDTFVDLAIASKDADQIVIIAGNGNGGFPSQHAYPATIVSVSGAVAGDFDDDGRLDLVLLNSGEPLMAWNNGTSFSSASIGIGSTKQAAVGDVNGDGIDDLISSGSRVGFGKLTRILAVVQLPGTLTDNDVIAVATLNGDARADIVGGGSALTVLTHNGTAFGTTHSFSIGEKARALAAADFDGDGKTDLAGAAQGLGYFWMVRGKGDGSLHADATFDVGSAIDGLALGLDRFIADVNGDGKMDFVAPTDDVREIAVRFGNGDGTFGAPIFTALPQIFTLPSLYDASDLNGDGRLDLVLWESRSEGAMHFRTLFSQTNGTFVVGGLQTSVRQIGNVTGLLRIVDYTGDGKPDLLEQFGLLHPGIGDGTFAAPIATGIDSWNVPTAVVDVDGDSDLDVLVHEGTVLSVYRNTGGGTFAAPVISTVDTAGLSAADINGDGLADLTSPSVALGVGNGTFTYGFQLETGDSVAGDFDNDGKIDLGVSGTPGMIYFGTGTGAFDHASQAGTAGQILSIADLDGDGADDLWMLNERWLTIVRTVPNQASSASQLDLSASANPLPYPKPGELIARPVPPSTTTRPRGAVLLSIPPAAPFRLGLVGADNTAKFGIYSPEVASPVTYATRFTGDSIYSPSDSQTLTIAATRGATTSKVAANTSVEIGFPVSVWGTVTNTYHDEFDLGSTITGTITIKKNGVLLRTLTAPAAGFTINDPAVFPVGTHVLTAEYSGDGNYLPSSSAERTVTIVNPTPTMVFPTPSSPITTEQVVSLTASFPNHPNVTGSVTFSCFGHLLGTAVIAGAQAALSTQLPWGQGTCTAAYSGSDDYAVTSKNTSSITVHYAAMPTAPLVDARRIAGPGPGLVAYVEISPISGASSYDIYRSLDGGGPLTLFTTRSDPWVYDSVPFGTKVAVYAAVARSSSGTVTPMGPRDFASFVTFTDHPIVTTATSVKAAHFTELQNAINALRVAAGLTSTTFAAPTGTISASHLTSLRQALTQARSALGLATPSFTDPTVTPGVTPVRAVHMEELREAVK